MWFRLLLRLKRYPNWNWCNKNELNITLEPKHKCEICIYDIIFCTDIYLTNVYFQWILHFVEIFKRAIRYCFNENGCKILNKKGSNVLCLPKKRKRKSISCLYCEIYWLHHIYQTSSLSLPSLLLLDASSSNKYMVY